MGPVGQLKAQAMAPVDLIDEEFRLRSLRLGLGHNVNSPKLGTRKPCEYGLSVGILGCFIQTRCLIRAQLMEMEMGLFTQAQFNKPIIWA